MHVQPFVVSASGQGGKQTASDNFDSYANGSTLAGQGNWVSLGGGQANKVVNPSGDGRAVGSTGDPYNINFYNSGTWATSGWSAATAFNTGQDTVAAVRCSTASGGNAYWAQATSSFGGLIRWGKTNSGTETQGSNTGITYAAGDVIRIEVTGTGAATRLTVKQNGVTKLGPLDPGGTYINSGNPGMGGGAGSGSSTTAGVTFWQASDT